MIPLTASRGAVGEPIAFGRVVTSIRHPHISLDRVGQLCQRQTYRDKAVEEGWPHVSLPGRCEKLVPRCWRLLLYKETYHNGSAYILPEPEILGPRKATSDLPRVAPYVTCCWDYSGQPIYTTGRNGPIYYARANYTGARLSGERLYDVAHQQDCCVPIGAVVNVRVLVAVYVLRWTRKCNTPKSGSPEYIDTRILEVTIDRCDPTPHGGSTA